MATIVYVDFDAAGGATSGTGTTGDPYGSLQYALTTEHTAQANMATLTGLTLRCRNTSGGSDTTSECLTPAFTNCDVTNFLTFEPDTGYEPTGTGPVLTKTVTGGYIATISVTLPFTVIDGFHLTCTHGFGQGGVSCESTGTDVTVRNSILEGGGITTGNACTYRDNFTLENSLIINASAGLQTNAGSQSCVVDSSVFAACTNPINAYHSTLGDMTCNNSAFFGNTNIEDFPLRFTGSFNATDGGTAPTWGTSWVTSIVTGDFESTGTEDYRAAAGGALEDAGSTALTVDMFATARAGTDDIGYYELPGTAVTITDVNTDEIVAHGETGVVWTGTTFGTTQDTGLVVICDSDLITDNPITQTVTAWTTGTTITTTGVWTGSGVAEGGTGYGFVTNGTGDSNASGFAITREDITVPTQTNPTANSITTDGVTPSCTANESGTMYMVLVPNADVPSVAQIKAGQQSSGAAAIASENAVCAASVEEVFTPVTGLALLTSYELYFVTNDGTNDSTAATVGFTTLAAPTITTTEQKNYSGQLQVSQTGWTVDVYTRSTGALVLHKTGLATDTGGIIAFSDASLSASTSYRIVTDNGTDMFGIQLQTTT